MEWLVVLGVIAAIGIALVSIYNRLVALRQNRENAYADIDVQLRLRFDRKFNCWSFWIYKTRIL